MGTRQWLSSAIVFCIAAVLAGVTGSSAAVLQVCGSGCAYTSIQAAIDAAASGDTVRVADGVYVELVDFKGKAVTVRSVNGPARTTIDGNALGSVVTFAGGEGRTSVLEGFTVTNGNSTGGGGGIACVDSSPTIRRCVIRGNTSLYFGGGIYCQGSSALIENCTVNGNSSSSGSGGGIGCQVYASPSIVNCTISGNRAEMYAGGIYCNLGSNIAVVSSTVSGNMAGVDGGGLWAAESAATVVNTIVWGNAAAGNNDQVNLASGTLAVSHSDVEGGWTGDGNIDAAPLFLDPRNASAAPTAGGDYRIAAGSPCIDAGADTGGSSYDITGDPRPQGAGYDIGSDEVALLRNGSFEQGDAPVPPGWRGIGLSPRDAKVSTAHTGFASFRMVGSTTGKELAQKFSFKGAAGDALDLACWHKVSRASAGGAFFGAALTVFHADGTTATHRVPFTTETRDWRQNRRVFSAAKKYTAVKVSLIYANRTGGAWFDDVRLSIRR